MLSTALLVGHDRRAYIFLGWTIITGTGCSGRGWVERRVECEEEPTKGYSEERADCLQRSTYLVALTQSYVSSAGLMRTRFLSSGSVTIIKKVTYLWVELSYVLVKFNDTPCDSWRPRSTLKTKAAPRTPSRDRSITPSSQKKTNRAFFFLLDLTPARSFYTWREQAQFDTGRPSAVKKPYDQDNCV